MTLPHCCTPPLSGLLRHPEWRPHAQWRRATVRQAPVSNPPRAAIWRCAGLVVLYAKAFLCRRRRRVGLGPEERKERKRAGNLFCKLVLLIGQWKASRANTTDLIWTRLRCCATCGGSCSAALRCVRPSHEMHEALRVWRHVASRAGALFQRTRPVFLAHAQSLPLRFRADALTRESALRPMSSIGATSPKRGARDGQRPRGCRLAGQAA